LRGGAFGYARELSVVLLDEDKVRAVMLGTMFSPEVGEVDVEAVDRTAAQTTAALHALLLRTMIKGGLEAGVKMARFRAHPGRHRQTVNFARRSGARPLGKQLFYTRQL
jgi:hypothetical protein